MMPTMIKRMHKNKAINNPTIISPDKLNFKESSLYGKTDAILFIFVLFLLGNSNWRFLFSDKNSYDNYLHWSIAN